MTETVPTPVASHAPTRPVAVTPEMFNASRGSLTICSIYPAALTKLINHNGRTRYHIEAAPRGSYSTLTVYDTQQWCQSTDAGEGRHQMVPLPIPVRIVAEDLVATWAGDTLGKRSGFKPGIGIIAGEIPTPQELAHLRNQQSALFNWYITSAMGLHMKGQGNEITDIHRLAAREMLDKGAERLPWFPVTDFEAVKRCVACDKQISATALRCDHCHQPLADWYLKYDLDATEDPVVQAFIDRIKSRTKAVSKA